MEWQCDVVASLMRLVFLDPGNGRPHLLRARNILAPLAATGRLDARRQRWLPDIAARLAALGG